MPDEEWGVKRVCPKCSVRFYDLRNDPMTCPACGAVFDIESLNAPKPKMSASKAKEAAAARESEIADDDDVVLDTEDEDEADGEIDDELLEDDDDDVDLDQIADVGGGDDET